MSKLDREIKAVMEEALENGQELMKIIFPIMLNEDMDEDEKTQKLAEIMEANKPKEYDDYVRDMKLVFQNNGWTEPKTITT